MSATWITYKSKKILYIDYRGLKTMEKKEELLNTAKQAGEMIKESREKILILSDIRDCNLGSDFMEFIKKMPTEKVGKHAIIGVEGIKKILVDSFERATGYITNIFDNEIEAKEFLIK